MKIESIGLTDQDQSLSPAHNRDKIKNGGVENKVTNGLDQFMNDGTQSDSENSDEGFGRDDEEEVNDAVNSLEPGAAIRKMQLLA